MTKESFRLTLGHKRGITGYLFILPFIVGFILFFLVPFIRSMIFSFSQIELVADGYLLHYVGWENYHHSLFVDPHFIRIFVESLGGMAARVPLVLAFSFFAASLLNQKFRGCWIFRVVFFLPVIMGAGIVLQLEQINFTAAVLQSGGQIGGLGEGSVSTSALFRTILVHMQFPESLTQLIMAEVDAVAVIIRSSGVQILVFLAGLQSIPKSLYESSNIEGATAWENLWKITFPLLTPLVLTNLVYTIVDSFTSPHNVLVGHIRDTAFGGAGFAVSTAMSWLYFLAVFVIVLITMAVVARGVSYQD